MTNIWDHANMSLEQAKQIVADLMNICGDAKISAYDVVGQHEREDYAEAIRVVLDYLP